MNKDELVDMLKTDDLLNTKLVRKNRDQLPLNIDIERLPKEEIAEKIGFKPIESLTLTKDYLSQVTNLKDALVLLSRLLHLVAKDAPTIKKTIDLASSRDNDTGVEIALKRLKKYIGTTLPGDTQTLYFSILPHRATLSNIPISWSVLKRDNVKGLKVILHQIEGPIPSLKTKDEMIDPIWKIIKTY